MNVNEWVCVPAQAVSDCLEYLDEECHFDHHGYCQAHGLQPAEDCFAAKLKTPPTPAPVPVDPAELEALRRDAARWRVWAEVFDTDQDELPHWMYEALNSCCLEDFCVAADAALAANGEKGT